MTAPIESHGYQEAAWTRVPAAPPRVCEPEGTYGPARKPRLLDQVREAGGWIRACPPARRRTMSCRIVDDAIALYKSEGRSLPAPTSGRDFANKMQHVA